MFHPCAEKADGETTTELGPCTTPESSRLTVECLAFQLDLEPFEASRVISCLIAQLRVVGTQSAHRGQEVGGHRKAVGSTGPAVAEGSHQRRSPEPSATSTRRGRAVALGLAKLATADVFELDKGRMEHDEFQAVTTALVVAAVL